jgi:hypothetical protein
MQPLYEEIKGFLQGLGADVGVKDTKRYHGFWHDTHDGNRVFAYVYVNPKSITIEVRPTLPLRPGLVELQIGKVCSRRIVLRRPEDLMDVKDDLRNCYLAK